MDSKEFDKELGKYFLDVSKLIFGGTVLASIIKIENVNYFYVMLLGFIMTFIIAFIGFIVIRKK